MLQELHKKVVVDGVGTSRLVTYLLDLSILIGELRPCLVVELGHLFLLVVQILFQLSLSKCYLVSFLVECQD